MVSSDVKMIAIVASLISSIHVASSAAAHDSRFPGRNVNEYDLSEAQVSIPLYGRKNVEFMRDRKRACNGKWCPYSVKFRGKLLFDNIFLNASKNISAFRSGEMKLDPTLVLYWKADHEFGRLTHLSIQEGEFTHRRKKCLVRRGEGDHYWRLRDAVRIVRQKYLSLSQKKCAWLLIIEDKRSQ